MADKYGYSYGYGLLSKSSSTAAERSRDGDFDEEDVWSVVKKDKSKKGSSSSGSRTIPKANSTSSSTHDVTLRQASAPVNIPNWSIMRNKNMRKKKKSWERGDVIDDEEEEEEEEEEEDAVASEEELEDGKVPPHEWIAKKLSRSQISSFSVHEGAGRTLKGRDLRKVRDAVLSKTGFLE